jgi:hypothetical protein
LAGRLGDSGRWPTDAASIKSAETSALFCYTSSVTLKITDETVGLRRQAERALRLARAIYDEQAAGALKVHAASLVQQAQSLEQDMPLHPPSADQERPAQQQQQIQPEDADKKE